jgi:Tfp pilus assembly protein PilV
MTQQSRAFTLVEVPIAAVILLLALAALLPLILFALRADQDGLHAKVAGFLSEELLEEIRLRRWDERTPEPPRAISGFGTLGADDGESADDKRTFDDVDDFQNWKEHPPMDPVMRPLREFSEYTRQVTVAFGGVEGSGASASTNIKRVRVCTRWKTGKDVCLETLVANR